MSCSKLSPFEIQRYHRQMILPEIGLSGQEKLKRARVLVVGAGGLGCPVLSYLVAAGIGTIKVADADKVDLTNLHRQPLFSESALGLHKVEEAVKLLRLSNSQVELTPLMCRLEAHNVRELVSDVEIVVDGSDNFATKYLLNDACVELGKSLVYGSIFCFEGQVAVFNAPLDDDTRGPTYRCLFPEPPPAELVPPCAEAGVLGVLPGVVGALQATEVLKLILEIGEPLSGRLLIFDALSMSFREVSFKRNKVLASPIRIGAASDYQALTASTCAAYVPQITAAELRAKLESGEALRLLDVREPYEKEEFDLGGELIPSAVLRENVQRIPREPTVVIYCRSGARSIRAVTELCRDFNFTNLVNLQGGVLAWQLEVAKHGDECSRD